VGAPQNCSFNGSTVAHNNEVDAFLNSNVDFGETCTKQKRKCTNGQLSGSYRHKTCKINSALNCEFRGKTIEHGEEVMAYHTATVPSGSFCNRKEWRVCENGILSGSYKWDQCVIAKPRPCTFDGKTVAHTDSIDAYEEPIAQRDNDGEYRCTHQNRVCNDGTLSGSFQFASCRNARLCILRESSGDYIDASNLHGSSIFMHPGEKISFFEKPVVSANESCVPQRRTCGDGVVSGTFKYTACEKMNEGDCLFDNSLVRNGHPVDTYASRTVPFGQSCGVKQAHCNNGKIINNFPYANCRVEPGPPGERKSCSFYGRTILHGQNMKYYTKGLFAITSMEEKTASCHNGVLDMQFPAYPKSNYESYNKPAADQWYVMARMSDPLTFRCEERTGSGPLYSGLQKSCAQSFDITMKGSGWKNPYVDEAGNFVNKVGVLVKPTRVPTRGVNSCTLSGVKYPHNARILFKETMRSALILTSTTQQQLRSGQALICNQNSYFEAHNHVAVDALSIRNPFLERPSFYEILPEPLLSRSLGGLNFGSSHIYGFRLPMYELPSKPDLDQVSFLPCEFGDTVVSRGLRPYVDNSIYRLHGATEQYRAYCTIPSDLSKKILAEKNNIITAKCVNGFVETNLNRSLEAIVSRATRYNQETFECNKQKLCGSDTDCKPVMTFERIK
jgi:hypothetical protein